MAGPIALLVLLCASVCAPAAVGRGGAPQYPAGAARPAIPAASLKPARSGSQAETTASPAHAKPARSRSQAESAASPSSRKPAHARKTKPGLHGDPARALLAYKAMQQYFYIQGTGLYKGEPYSYLWPFSQALAATVSAAHISGQARPLAGDLHARLYGLQRYLEKPAEPTSSEQSTAASVAPPASFAGTVAPPLGAGGPSYYDDNEWVGLELARVYELNGEASALAQAKQIMAFVMAGWETVNPTSGKPLPCPGGVPFSNAEANTSRNTVTDAPAVELGVVLYRITRDPQYLSFAQMAYAWVRQCLLAANGMYADHIQNNGEIEPMQWSYNQGSMMGAGALLYQATGDGAYLYDARQTAKAALAYYTTEKLELENPFFACVYFRNLLYLDSVTRDPPGAKLVQAYVDYAWENLRVSGTLFVSGSPSTSTLLGQAAIVQLYALLSTPARTYF